MISTDMAIKKIILCSDMTPQSESAMRFAVEIAKSTGGIITIFHAFYMMIPIGGPNFFPVLPEVWDETEKEIREKMNDLCKKIHEENHVETIPVVCETIGTPENRILYEAEALKADLIILGSKNIEGLTKLFGTTASKVVGRRSCPVLVVPESSVYTGFANMIYAVDLNENMEHIDKVLNFAKLFNSQVNILHIDNPGNIAVDQKRFASFKKSVLEQKNYPHLRFDSITYRDTALAINDYSNEQKADLLVLVKHHYSLFEGIFHKSVTKEILFEAKIPVLVFH